MFKKFEKDGMMYCGEILTMLSIYYVNVCKIKQENIKTITIIDPINDHTVRQFY